MKTDNYHSAIISLLIRGQYTNYFNVFDDIYNFKKQNNIYICHIDEDPFSNHYSRKCGDDTYLIVKFRYQKLENEEYYADGFYYTAYRTFKLSHILMEQRKIKLEKILK